MKHRGELIKGATDPRNRLLIGVPMTGLIRAEWAMARYGQIIPCNWSHTDAMMWLNQMVPLRFSVADARNLVVARAVRDNYEWLLFIDHDVILPPDAFIKINQYMQKKEYPIVNGLYFTRGLPAEPLIYRGLGTSHYTGWKLGDKVWADGAGMGCTLIDVNILKAVFAESDPYTVQGTTIRRVFHTPAECVYNEGRGVWESHIGTEDLHFYHRLKSGGFFTKAGWSKFQRKEYPLLIDTSIFCRHIDNTGMQYPIGGEEKQFIRKLKKKVPRK